MIIGIDGNEANVKNRVGVNKYAFEMIWGLYKLTSDSNSSHSLIVYLKNEPQKDLPKERQNFKYKVINGGGLWIITKLTPHLFRNPDKLQVLFSPSHYTPPLLTIPRVASIMDLGYLEFSEHFEKKVLWQLTCWSAISIFVSKRILTISDSSKKDIVRHYPFAAKKTVVTLLGFDKDKFNKAPNLDDIRSIKKRYSIVSDYILYIGTLKPSKNIGRLIESFASLPLSQHSNLSLVIAGKKGWMYEDLYKKVKELNLQDRVVFTDFVSESDKAGLIAGAKVFVLPSLWEGFGLDVLSALALGIPAVVSTVGSLPEVAGKAGTYVDPYSIDSIAGGLIKVLNMSKSDYNKIVKLGYDQVKKFDWETCARKTLEVLENIND